MQQGHGPPPQITFDEYVGLSGAARAWGVERMCGYYRLDPSTWNAIDAAWRPTVGTNPHFQPMVEQEAARIQMGGQPRMITSLGIRDLERGAAQIGDALGSFFGGVAKAIAPPAVGSQVLVQWSDGNRYPGTVAQVAQGQYLVTMANGQQHWVPASLVTLP